MIQHRGPSLPKRPPAMVAELIECPALLHEAWRRLKDAADDPADPFRLVVLSNVDERGWPSSRLMLLRGAERGAARLWFHADARSRKIAHLRCRPRICVIGYDHQDGTELRLDGRAAIHTDDRTADEHWQQIEMAVRYSYAAACPPAQPVAEIDPRSNAARQRLAAGDPELGRQHFAVIEMTVESIEWFQSTTLGQRRALLRASEDWSVRPLTP